MNRDDILALVVRHVADAVEGLQPAEVDAARSMTDLGLTSLDIVEVVTRSMRGLQVTIPRPQLRKLRTIDALVDVLHNAVAARQE
jgi:acyl carrier protein